MNSTDICIWQLWRAGSGREWQAMSLENANFPMTGRDAALMTLGDWKIHPLGVSRKSLYMKSYSSFSSDFFTADEIITRLAFINSNRVSICMKRYFYSDNPSSTTRTFHLKRLSVLDAQLKLIQLCDTTMYLTSQRSKKWPQLSEQHFPEF